MVDLAIALSASDDRFIGAFRVNFGGHRINILKV
jgi:hypothetical protein